DVVTEAGGFVIIDLQPGRANFLDQAKRYEEFLRLPNVGLALDPEWRIGPNALPLQRIGSVSADEVNAVSDWLVELVHEETLPQKPFVIHQFLRSMVPDREDINTPPELATVIHVDGQGGLAAKFQTYRNVTGQEITTDQKLWWGWKNFYDEDRPVARPDQVWNADPLPVIITFQ
ncbi:MAG: MBL fold metallo-hydrolase, partial [Acidimicrobiales bacterium]|nr:MBL fold metallo-hydrolase [Acidimicrobiales bacterium]